MTHTRHLCALAQEIVRHHLQLALQPDALQRLSLCGATLSQPATDQALTDTETVRLAVIAACQALDFIDADAICIAQAWQVQTERTGTFDASAWPVEPADFGLQPLPRENAFAPCPHQLGLYAVLPDAHWVRRMARAGVPTLQLRFKSDDASAISREVHAAVQAVRGTDALLFINDHWESALEAGAYGVHLGQEDLEGLSSTQLAAIRNAGLRLGVSSHGYAEMLRADAVSPSYIAMGAVYATTLKRMTTPPQGPTRLKMYTKLLRDLPTVAIAGLDATRLPEVLASGVGSVAVVRALVAADQPEAHAAELQKTLATHLMKARCLP
jgi:thiamine-phosphate pyrophosphorylase